MGWCAFLAPRPCIRAWIKKPHGLIFWSQKKQSSINLIKYNTICSFANFQILSFLGQGHDDVVFGSRGAEKPGRLGRRWLVTWETTSRKVVISCRRILSSSSVEELVNYASYKYKFLMNFLYMLERLICTAYSLHYSFVQ